MPEFIPPTDGLREPSATPFETRPARRGPNDFDANTCVAELREVALSAAAQVMVSFGDAKERIDGVSIYSRRQGTSPWNFLARDTQSPYVDTTPLAQTGIPEIREYRVRGVIDDFEIGDYSLPLQITVT